MRISDWSSDVCSSDLRIEGSDGAMMVKLGLLLDYPTGEPDELWFARRGGPWEQVPLDGAWFPDAFIGPMANLQRVAAGEDDRLATAVEDADRKSTRLKLQYLMRISYAVFCLQKTKRITYSYPQNTYTT